MNLNLIILLFLFLGGISYSSLKILMGSGNIIEKVNNTLVLLSLGAIIFNISFCLYIYYSLLGKGGERGPKGIRGEHGQNGKDGVCTAKCGKAACYSLVLKHIKTFMDGKNLGELNNTFIKNRINKICYSEHYIGFLTSSSDKKPNEKGLIDYISSHSLEWVKIILKFKNGVRFLNSQELEESFYDKNITPFKEIKKYEIWGWGGPYRFKPIIRQQCSNKKELPNAEQADLEIVYTNSYSKPVFVNEMNPPRYGPDDCPHNQLGENKTRNDVAHCFYYNESGDKVVAKKTWKKEEYNSFSQDISLYNLEPKTISNKKYYPVGTVWRGNNNIYQDDKKERYGPRKETILVSEMNTKPPTDFIKIWSTADKECDNCIPGDNSFSVWRPIAPKGYVSLGDYIARGDIKPNLDVIRCVPIKCVQEIKILNDSSIWDEKGFVKNERTGFDSKPTSKKFAGKVSLWPIGITDKAEEIVNYSYKKINPLRVAGYNLFRANNSYSKPSKDHGKGWEIKTSCYKILKTDDPDIPSSDIGIGWLGGKQRDNNYSAFTDLGYTLNGFITNNDIKKDEKQGFYIDHVKEDHYALRGFNKKTRKFDKFLLSNETKISYTNEINNSIHNSLWKINLIDDKEKLIKLVSSNGRCLHQDVHGDGTISIELNGCEHGGTQWKFSPSTGYSFKS
jgi:hypothetical protein